jgi:predicted small metal-binding protein
MSKVLRCGDLMPGCDFEARGDSEQEVLQKAAEHAKTDHNMTEIPEGLMAQVRGAIHDDDDKPRAQSA